MSASRSAAFACLSVLRRICNHPDLLLDKPDEVEKVNAGIVDYTEDDQYGSEERNWKLKVLLPIMQTWHNQHRRCLVFSQSLDMLSLIEAFASQKLDVLPYGRNN